MDDFNNWFKNIFLKRYPNGFVPKDVESWLKLIDFSHQQIRETLGGFRKEIEVSTEISSVPSNYNDCKNLIDQIIRIIPDYYRAYGLNQYDLCKDKLAKCKNISTAKHILGYAERQKISKDKLSKVVSELGAIWSQSKTKKISSLVTVSTIPEAFLRVGSYYCDPGSCFIQGGMNCDKKYTYSIHPNSFVLLVSNGPAKEQDLDFRPIGRCLGFIDYSDNTFNVSNTKYDHNIDVGTFRSVIEEAAKKVLFKEGKVSHISNGFRHDGGINYMDPYCWTFYQGQKEPKHKTIIFPTKFSKERFEDTGRTDYYANWNY